MPRQGQYQGPFTRKMIKGIYAMRVTRYDPERYFSPFATEVVDRLESLSRETMHPRIFNGFRERFRMFDCARQDIRTGRLKEALDDIATTEEFLHLAYSEKLDNIGDGAICYLLSPISAGDKLGVVDLDGNIFSIQGIRLDASLSSDKVEILPRAGKC